MNQKDVTPTTRQLPHFLGVIILFLSLSILLQFYNENIQWVLIAGVTAVLHQGLVAIVWRAELFGNHITRKFGYKGFKLYGVLFFIFLALRIISTVGASFDSPYTLPISPELSWVLTAVTGILCAWALLSVFFYFGTKRALGADHFFPEYKNLLFVRKGIFRYTSNGMYTFGILAFIIPGLVFRSNVGLAVGIIHYAAIWLHYWATELPDIIYIYGNSKS